MALTYFVTEAYLKQATALTKNIDANEIVPFITVASDTWMQSILGSYFYDHLLLAYNAQTLTADEEILVSKMKPAIAWRATSDCVVELTYQIKNKGIQKQSGDNSESVDLTETGFVKTHYENKAEFYESFLVDYLRTNKAKFPEFIDKQNKTAIIAPQDDNNFNSVFLFI